MDKDSQEKFDKIVRMEPAALTAGDIEFLKVRRSYLTASDLERYGHLLDEPKAAEEEQQEEAAPKKKK